MKNLFSTEYALQLETTKNYKAAKAANDEAGMEAARAAHMEQEARIEAMGTTFSRLYDRYVSAQERGNEYIDWDDVIWDNQVEGFVAGLREYGIEKFVFFLRLVERCRDRLEAPAARLQAGRAHRNQRPLKEF